MCWSKLKTLRRWYIFWTYYHLSQSKNIYISGQIKIFHLAALLCNGPLTQPAAVLSSSMWNVSFTFVNVTPKRIIKLPIQARKSTTSTSSLLCKFWYHQILIAEPWSWSNSVVTIAGALFLQTCHRSQLQFMKHGAVQLFVQPPWQIKEALDKMKKGPTIGSQFVVVAFKMPWITNFRWIRWYMHPLRQQEIECQLCPCHPCNIDLMRWFVRPPKLIPVLDQLKCALLPPRST